MKIQEVYYTLGDQIRRAERTQQDVVTISIRDAQFLRNLIAPPKVSSSNQHAAQEFIVPASDLLKAAADSNRCPDCGYLHGGHKSTCSQVRRLETYLETLN